MASDAEGTVLDFVARINAHDVEAILALSAPDHVFMDSLGRAIVGRETMRQPWRQYFELFPDYRIAVHELASADGTVAVFGTASATCARGSDPRRAFWTVPTAWRARVAGGLVAEWQVYADLKPVYEILAAG
ncbi:MAG: nuclear transport factor 2 family protein [Thermoanaerobaculia bacterium]